MSSVDEVAVLEMALCCTLPANTDYTFLLGAAASSIKESHGVCLNPRSASTIVPSPDTCLWYVRVSLGCSPAYPFASPSSSHLCFMGNKLRPKGNHDTFFQNPKQGTYCQVFQTCILQVASCLCYFKDLWPSPSANSHHLSCNTVFKNYFS